MSKGKQQKSTMQPINNIPPVANIHTKKQTWSNQQTHAHIHTHTQKKRKEKEWQEQTKSSTAPETREKKRAKLQTKK